VGSAVAPTPRHDVLTLSAGQMRGRETGGPACSACLTSSLVRAEGHVCTLTRVETIWEALTKHSEVRWGGT
jgi:hypothetical protein